MVGLGNPGERYARTRHNVAWRVLDELAARHRAVAGEAHETYRTRRLVVAGRELSLLVPLTFMNASGEALQAWRERHGLEEEGLLAVTDDVYLPLGVLRLREQGSSGGHRGLESLEAAVAGPQYARMRVGVGAAESSAELKEHVLEEFAPEEIPALDAAVRRAADAVECWVSEGLIGAMNRFNRRIPEEESRS